MKIIRVVGNDLDFHPDSSLITGSNPFFYPDFAGEWVADMYIAVHINRLGKSISEKFAPRYYDGIGLGLHFRPADENIIPSGTLSGIDSTFAHGPWFAPEATDGADASFGGIDLSLQRVSSHVIDSTVAAVSRYTTLRMGDIILIPYPETAPVAVKPRSRFTAGNLIDLKIV